MQRAQVLSSKRLSVLSKDRKPNQPFKVTAFLQLLPYLYPRRLQAMMLNPSGWYIYLHIMLAKNKETSNALIVKLLPESTARCNCDPFFKHKSIFRPVLWGF